MKYRVLLLFVVLSRSVIWSQSGCTDPLATNFNAMAAINDGSCLYAFTAQSPDVSMSIPDVVMETSGLIFYNHRYWTHNDDTDPAWYALDSITGQVTDTIFWSGMQNIDWEDIQQNAWYFFIGDIGNNSGNRTDLKILRIPKSGLAGFSLSMVDTISFHYEDQLDFNNASNDHDYDSEAFLVEGDSIYLFTKCWASHTTSMYTFPNTPGDYTAMKRASWDAQGMITGAHRMENQDHLVLVGYNELLQPFVVLLYDFPSTQFLSGNKRKISLAMPFFQMEAICSADGFHYYLTNEQFFQGFTVPAQLHHWDATEFFQAPSSIDRNLDVDRIFVYPNPASDYVEVSGLIPFSFSKWRLYHESGQLCNSGVHWGQGFRFSMRDLPPGNYILRIFNQEEKVIRILHF